MANFLKRLSHKGSRSPERTDALATNNEPGSPGAAQQDAPPLQVIPEPHAISGIPLPVQNQDNPNNPSVETSLQMPTEDSLQRDLKIGSDLGVPPEYHTEEDLAGLDASGLNLGDAEVVPLPSRPLGPVYKLSPDQLLPAGSTVSAAQPTQAPADLAHSWSNVDGAAFPVRIGPHYAKHGKKQPSAAALYTMVGMDWLRCAKRVDHISQSTQLPTPPWASPHPDVPSLLVVNAQLPLDPPAVFKQLDDGPTQHAVLYFVLTPETCEALRDVAAAPPAVKQLVEYCRNAERDEAVRGRFKAMGFVVDMDSLNLPSFITPYNGKPVLITKSGGLSRGANYLEMDINLRHWCFLARKGIYHLQPKCDQMVLNIGFVLEGRRDDELPECILGCAQVHRLSMDKALDIEAP